MKNILIDITGKIELWFNSDTNSDSDITITQLDGNIGIDLLEMIQNLKGKTVRIVITDEESK